MQTPIIGVYAAVSVGKVIGDARGNREGLFTLTLMQRPGGSSDNYGGYKEVHCEHVPVHVEPENLITPSGRIDSENWEDAKTHWDMDDGGPWELREENGVYVIEAYNSD